MTIGEALKKAVAEGNAVMAGRIACFLRLKHGANYLDVYQLAHKVTGISEEDWEGLMYEADYYSSGGAEGGR